MKLAKKMLACALALAMVAALALTAFAAAPVVSLTATEYAKVGDKVEVTVSATGMAGLESADLEFKFDDSVLKFESIDSAEGAKFSAAGGVPEGEAGVVTFSLAYTNSATADSGICVIVFEVLKDESSDITFGYTSWAGTEEPAAASVTVAKKAPVVTTTEAPAPVETTTAAPAEDESEVPTTGKDIPQTGEAGVAAIAGVMALAAVAFVATRKKDEE